MRRILSSALSSLPSPRFTYVSPAVTSITGYTPEEHYADPDLAMKMVHPDDRPRFVAQLHAHMHDPNRLRLRVCLKLRWVRKDGRVVWTEQRNRASS